MTTHLSRIALLAVEVEAVAGTTVAPTLPGDANLVVYEPNIQIQPTITPRNPVHSKLSNPTACVGGELATLTFRVELKGSGTAGTAPSFEKLMLGCGLDATNVPVTSDTYAADDVNFLGTGKPSTLTMDLYQDKRRFRTRGAMGTMRMVARTNEPAMLEFEFQGVLDSTDPLTDDDVASVAAITYETTKPPSFMGSNIASFFGTTPFISQFEFDLGNEVTVIPSANDPSGYTHARIVKRAPVGTFDMEAIENATFNNTVIGKWLNVVEGALSVTIGTVAGNIIAIDAAAIQVTNVTPADRDGIVVDNVSFQVNATLGTDGEFSIAFT